MSCPWAKIEKTESVKLEEIISEELARNLQATQERKCAKVDNKLPTTEVNVPPSEKIADDGFGIDTIHQMKFDGECVSQLECAEDKCSSFYIDNCRRLSLNDDFESDTEEEEVVNIRDEKHWDAFDPLEKEFACVPRNVFKKNKKMEIVEHASISGDKNTCKLSSKVFNSLELPTYREEFRKYKVHRDKQKRPASKLLGIDEHAWCLIHELIKDQVLHKVVDIISFNKEAVILRAVQYWLKPVGPKWYEKMASSPIYCMVKVFKMNLKLGKARITACQKAEREVANYGRLKAAGISCPTVIARKERILVTSYPFGLLADFNKPYGRQLYYWGCLTGAYDKVREMMKKLYEANLIHADLSEHSILFNFYEALIINAGQCVERSHKNAFNYLFRGCTNIFNFFKRKGAQKIVGPDENFFYITGYSYLNKLSLSELQESVKKKREDLKWK